MCEPISIGIAIGATTGAISSAVTGGDVLKGALMGAVMGGVTGGMGGLGAGTTASAIGSNLGSQSFFQAMNMALPATLSSQALVGFAATSLVGGIGLGMMTPEQQNYNLGATALPYGPQAYSSQHSTVTGSGGRQAAAVLASEIKQAKSLRKRQAEASESFGLGMGMAETGLQIA